MQVIIQRNTTEDGGWDTKIFKIDALGRPQSVAFHKKNGILISIGFFQDGKHHGVWTWYHNLNEVERKELYDNGHLIGTVFYTNSKKIARIEKEGQELYIDELEAKSFLKKIKQAEKNQNTFSFIESFEARKDKEAEEILQARKAKESPVSPQKKADQSSTLKPNTHDL